jgi:ABC-type nitrate/sulfonate/bicarbonate transport system ATPase subunit
MDIRGSAIDVRGLGHNFGPLKTLADLSFVVAEGETVAIVGTSGCGKSTLLEIVGGLAEPGSGTVSVGGEVSTPARLGHCTWMPQRDLLLPWRRVIDNAALALRIGGASRREARAVASQLLERLGLREFERSYPGQLSGGMRQRVAFARTLLAGKPVLLLDEPFASLDAITRADLQEWLLGTLREERRTTLLVTHDVEEALYLADRVLLLSPRPGHVVWEAPSPADRSLRRPEAISSPDFVACRERALLALAESNR